MEKSEIIPSSGDRDLGPLLIGINWIVFGPSCLIVVLRCITRIWITHNFGWDDATMVLAMIFNALGMGFVWLEVLYGLGRHRQYLPPYHYQWFLKYNYLDWIQVFITLGISKISICLFLLRISKFEKYRNFLFGLIFFLVIAHTPITLLYMLQCIPFRKNWVPESPGYCFSKPAVEIIIIIQGVCSILTDFIGAAFPIILLWNARLSLRTKICLNLLMGLGVITGVTCIVRTTYSWEILSDDLTWVGVGNALTRILEVNFGILAGCAPIMRPLYLHLRSRFSSPPRTGATGSVLTPASRLQWYTPPSATPWYKRVFHAPEPRDKMDGIPDGSDVSHSPIAPPSPQQPEQPDPLQQPQNEKSKGSSLTVGQRWPMLRQRSTGIINKREDKAKRKEEKSECKKHEEIEKRRKRRDERPENVTWAKNDVEKKFSDSFDLPMQGVRKSGGDVEDGNGGGNERDEGGGDADDDGESGSNIFGTYRFNRGWV